VNGGEGKPGQGYKLERKPRHMVAGTRVESRESPTRKGNTPESGKRQNWSCTTSASPWQRIQKQSSKNQKKKKNENKDENTRNC